LRGPVTLYQTRGGAFFIVHAWENDEGHAKIYFEAMSREEVRRLVERTDNLAIVNSKILDEPPEAEEEDETPGATLYLRVPASLKERIELAATVAKLSVNAWAMRCMENCLGDGGPYRDLPPDEREVERLNGSR
jgi:predicted HicB family RNase H-like nuclease